MATTRLAPGFDFQELETLLEIAQQTYTGIPPTKGAPPVPTPPAKWQLDTDLTPSGQTLLDNFWQVWRNQDDHQYAIAIRGTVETPASIFEDIFLPILRARISLSLEDCGIPCDLDFDFAQDEGDSAVVAGVHAGFALGLLLMFFTTDSPLWATLFLLPDDAQVFITGHSQGASVALLLTSFVRHSSLFASKTYKTYVFAPAKPGNDHYAYDLDQIAGVPGWAFSAVSTQDWVPQVPLTLQGLRAINTPNPIVPFSGSATAAARAALPSAVREAGAAAETAEAHAAGRFEGLLEKIEAGLPTQSFGVTGSQLGVPDSSAVLGSSCLESLLHQLEDLVLPSLNFAKAGSLVPAFATPGTNPVDPSDAFWQHHLGNYLKYLTEQYGG